MVILSVLAEAKKNEHLTIHDTYRALEKSQKSLLENWLEKPVRGVNTPFYKKVSD